MLPFFLVLLFLNAIIRLQAGSSIRGERLSGKNAQEQYLMAVSNVGLQCLVSIVSCKKYFFATEFKLGLCLNPPSTPRIVQARVLRVFVKGKPACLRSRHY